MRALAVHLLIRGFRAGLIALKLDLSAAERDGILTIHVALNRRPGFLSARR